MIDKKTWKYKSHHTPEAKAKMSKAGKGKLHPWAKGELNAKCKTCGKEFHTVPWRLKHGHSKYCSWYCFTHRLPNIKCEICKKEFYRKPYAIKKSKHQYCSHFCYAYSLRGHTGKNKGKEYITPLSHLIKSSIENSEWRKQIFQRDKYRCQECFMKSNNIEAHHIKPFSEILREFLNEYSQFSPMEDKETLMRLAINYKPFWDTSNGITLCEKCHKVHMHHWRIKQCMIHLP